MSTPNLDHMNDGHVLQVIAERIDYLHGDIGEMKTAIKDLASAIIKLALIEERQGQAALQLNRAFDIMEKLEARIVVLENCAPTYKQTAAWVHSGIWAAAGLAILIVLNKVGLL